MNFFHIVRDKKVPFKTDILRAKEDHTESGHGFNQVLID